MVWASRTSSREIVSKSSMRFSTISRRITSPKRSSGVNGLGRFGQRLLRVYSGVAKVRRDFAQTPHAHRSPCTDHEIGIELKQEDERYCLAVGHPERHENAHGNKLVNPKVAWWR